MSILSKEAFNAAVIGRQCYEFNHPWSQSCLGGLYRMFISALLGSATFSLALTLLQLISEGKNITKSQLCNILQYGVRLTLCGTSIAVILVSGMCLQRNLWGEFNYNSIVFVPGVLSGLSIFVLPSSKRHFLTSAFSCAFLETLLCTLWTKNQKIPVTISTPFFMLSNSLFMYFLKLWKMNKSDQLPKIWFFSPSHISAARSNQHQSLIDYPSKAPRPCNHIQSCVKSIIKETSNYFWFGTAIEVIRIIVSNFKTFVKNPQKVFPFLFKKSTLRLAAFAGLYVFLYKITNCGLCRLCGKDTASNALIAGFVSGLAHYVHPNLSLNITVFVNLIHMMWRYFNMNEKFLGNLPTSEFIFMFTCGYLMHNRVMNPDYCSRFFLNLISLTTGGRSTEMYNAFIRYV